VLKIILKWITKLITHINYLRRESSETDNKTGRYRRIHQVKILQNGDSSYILYTRESLVNKNREFTKIQAKETI
jgi:hypothetical protein